MFLPAICSLYYNEADLLPIVYSAFITMGIGIPGWWFFRKHNELGIKDGIFIAVFSIILLIRMPLIATTQITQQILTG